MTSKQRLLIGSAVIALNAACASLNMVQAQELEGQYVFDIKPQPLEEALIAFSAQSGVQVIASGDLVSGQKASPYVGNNSPKTALLEILAGTTLSYKVQGVSTVLIVDENAEGAVQKPSRSAPVSGHVGGASGEDVSFVLEEIIVTATRREAGMQDIPATISAYSANQLQASGVQNIYDLQFLSPGMTISNNYGQSQVAIRGIGTDNQAVGSEAGVAVHSDGVYIAQLTALDAALFDLERIEVMKGPQGTLYGRNSTGGTVNIITKSPTPEFEAGAGATFGNYTLIQTNGYISGPLIDDKLMARVSFTTGDRRGYARNILRAGYTPEHVNNLDMAAIRAKLRYQPNENMTFDIGAHYLRDSSLNIALNYYGSGIPAGGSIGSAMDREVNHNYPDAVEKWDWGLHGKAEVVMGDLILTSLTAFRKHSFSEEFDLDKTELERGSLLVDNGFKQFSQEVTLGANEDGRLNWLIGANYFNSSASSQVELPIPDFLIFVETPVVEGQAYAAFGEMSYRILDQLTVTLGARYSYEKKKFQASTSYNNVLASTTDLDDSWRAFTPKASVSYDINENAMLYATVSRGFKAGGANNQNTYGPEYVWSYEVGLKTSMLDKRLRANLSAFLMDYTDLQVQTVRLIGDNQVSSPFVANAGKAKIKGVEVELDLRPTNQFSLDANIAYLDAVYTEAAFPDTLNGNLPIDGSGNRLTRTPKWSTNLGIQYEVPLGSWGSLTLRGEHTYKTSYEYTPQNYVQTRQGSYHWVNARLTFESEDRQLSIAFWGKNLTDELVSNFKNVSPTAGDVNWLPPRTYGVTLGYRF